MPTINTSAEPTVRASSWLPTNKAVAGPLGAAAGTFLYDVLAQLWTAMPPSAEPFFVIALGIAAAWLMPERAGAYVPPLELPDEK